MEDIAAEYCGDRNELLPIERLQLVIRGLTPYMIDPLDHMIDPLEYEQKIRGTQAWFYQSSGTTGVDDAGSTVATHRPTSMKYQVAFLDLF